MDFFDMSYEGTPPWHTGRPQGAFVRLEEAGQIQGSVLDVGCGTGENALYLAGRGHEVWGIAASPKAIAKAKAKASDRSLEVVFKAHDALHLGRLQGVFETIIDSGLFHTFSDVDRKLFTLSLRKVMSTDSHYILLCFSEREPGEYGPRRVTKEEIRSTFSKGWQVLSIQEDHFEDNLGRGGAHAWLARIRRD